MTLKKNINKGMTLPEFIFAVMMLSAFMGVFVLVTAFVARFFQPLNEEAKIEYIDNEKELTDVLSDHMIINETIDLPVGFVIGTSFICGSIAGSFLNINIYSKKN